VPVKENLGEFTLFLEESRRLQGVLEQAVQEDRNVGEEAKVAER
jgi:hypothetical protein